MYNDPMRNYGSKDWAPEEFWGLIHYIDSKLHIECRSCGRIRSTSGKKSVRMKYDSGVDVFKCLKCKTEDFSGIKLFTHQMAKSLNIKIDNKFERIGKNIWVGKWCFGHGEFVKVRMSSLIDSYENGRSVGRLCGKCKSPGFSITSSGYKLVTAKDHPMANRDGYMLEHRLVMEIAVGRYLYPFETVHHMNGDKLDNRPENLQLRSGQHGQGVVVHCGDCGSKNIAYGRI